MQRSLCNTADATEATCNGMHAARCTPHGTPHDVGVQHTSTSMQQKKNSLHPFDTMQHATCNVSATTCDMQYPPCTGGCNEGGSGNSTFATAAWTRNTHAAPSKRKLMTQRGPRWQPEPELKKCQLSQRAEHVGAHSVGGNPAKCIMRATHNRTVRSMRRTSAHCPRLVLSMQGATRNPPYPNSCVAVTNTATA